MGSSSLLCVYWLYGPGCLSLNICPSTPKVRTTTVRRALRRNLCRRNPAPTSPNPNCCNRVLQHYLQANFSMFWRSSLPIRGIRSRLGFRFCNGFGLDIPWDKTVISNISGEVKLALKDMAKAPNPTAHFGAHMFTGGPDVRNSHAQDWQHQPWLKITPKQTAFGWVAVATGMVV